MRGKIIAVFAVIVVVLGGLWYALARAAVADLSRPATPPRALASVARLHLDALVLERWIAVQASDPKVREPYNAGTPLSRAEGATGVANKLREVAASAPELSGIPVQLIVLVDKEGVVVGRNGSALMRGDNLGAAYPALKRALDKGMAGSDVWVSPARNEQMLTSFAPIRDEGGQIIGGIAVGTAIDDGRLSDVSERSSSGILLAVVTSGPEVRVVAKSSGAPPELVTALSAGRAKEGVGRALGSSQVVDLGGLPAEYYAWGQSLEGYGDGRQMAIVTSARQGVSSALNSLIWPALGVTILGLVLVAIGAYFLDAYISRPVAELEEGLLAIMNGRTDRRFEIEHAELGGLVFRLNSLLNQMFDVQEDDTDDEGRPSRAPEAASFRDALAVDERMAQLGADEIADAVALRNEPADAYYERIFNEYIQAKTDLGDPVDHITKESFVAQIQASEREMSDKHARPFRYKIEVRGREVVLIAVPLA